MTRAPDNKGVLAEIRERLDRLSPERLRVARDFLAYLEEREENEATQELLRVPGFEDAHTRALEEIARGETVPFARIRREP